MPLEWHAKYNNRHMKISELRDLNNVVMAQKDLNIFSMTTDEEEFNRNFVECVFLRMCKEMKNIN